MMGVLLLGSGRRREREVRSDLTLRCRSGVRRWLLDHHEGNRCGWRLDSDMIEIDRARGGRQEVMEGTEWAGSGDEV
jgi:hypothetical protein